MKVAAAFWQPKEVLSHNLEYS
uniref:Uncharacterized protein n=1 Tax=Tetraselmis sp. GSL018 TaxID=582737 RepID=A0A061RRJ6_9CHLO